MNIAATNTVTIHVIPGQYEVVGTLLQTMVDTLRKSTGCLSYAALQSHFEPGLWIVTAHWDSPHDMETHFHNAAQEKYAELLNCTLIRSIEFHSQSIA
ncbi:putative quinol monooxygenase [Pseudomonas sp. NPDC096950]|uniref:putative quinol monooxygenase n=1 Tax=Pseudomonas sp. NPDC096950 TaxID=3364485 RepID=UPI00383BA7CB